MCNSLYFTLLLSVSTNVENTKHSNTLNGCNDVRAFVYILTYWGTPVHACLNPNWLDYSKASSKWLQCMDKSVCVDILLSALFFC